MADMEFQYAADQAYQLEAIDAVTGLFEGQEFLPRTFTADRAHVGQKELPAVGYANSIRISPKQLEENLHMVQESNSLPSTSVTTDGSLRDFTVEMETGTGKTYVYIRTIYDLNAKYGLNKFVIVVPSIAVREGVLKSFQSMQAHFDELYDRAPLDVFVYDGQKLGSVTNFALSNAIEVMIINIAAFNKEKGNKFYQQGEALIGGRSPQELIAECNPVVVIDEPQSAANTSKSQAAIRSMNPLAVLRYSATHRDTYNMLYRLTPIDAFQQHLVKGICVDSVRSQEDFNGAYVRVDSVKRDGSAGDQPIRARITVDARQQNGGLKRTSYKCKTGDDLYIKSKENSNYDGGWQISNISNEEENKYVEFRNGTRVAEGETIGHIPEEVIKRAQIRRTIIDHLEKQLELYPYGVKVLSLFFIDKVAKYRVYGEGNTWEDGEYAKMFEEEYTEELRTGPWVEAYKERGIPLMTDPSRIHQGYFSQDKQGRLKDTQNGLQSGETPTYQAIMRSKERLVSFPDGTDDVKDIAFIFSHSALNEGWDNPNIFQICTLVDTRDVIPKRQKIGRGLRLCVDQEGRRNFDPNVNTLTVIANESYEEFAQGLQQELEKSGYEFGRLTPEIFAAVTIVDAQGHEHPMGYQKSKELYDFLQKQEYIDEKGNITQLLKKAAEDNSINLPEIAEGAREQITSIVQAQSAKLSVKNKANEVKVALNKDVTNDPRFQELWDKIRQRTRFELTVDTEKLIARAAEAIADMPKIEPIEIISSRASLTIDEQGVESELDATSIVSTAAGALIYDLPDPIAELQDVVCLTRRTIKRILEESGRFDEFKVDPARFLTQVAAKIEQAKQAILAKGIRYHKLPESEWYTMEILDTQDLTAFLDQNAYKPKNNKSLYNYVVYDSDTVERPFAAQLDLAEEVKVFAKLPSKFTIDTPAGSYNPDWAYVTEDKSGQKRVFFVTETKGGGNNTPTLNAKEKAKTECAKKHFEALDNGVQYSIRTTYHS